MTTFLHNQPLFSINVNTKEEKGPKVLKNLSKCGLWMAQHFIFFNPHTSDPPILSFIMSGTMPVSMILLLRNCSINAPRNHSDHPKGVIHKPRGQNFGYFWPPFPLCGHFYLCCKMVIWLTPFPLNCLRGLWMTPNATYVINHDIIFWNNNP